MELKNHHYRSNDLFVKAVSFDPTNDESYQVVGVYDPHEYNDDHIHEMLKIAEDNEIEIPWERDPKLGKEFCEKSELFEAMERDGIEFDPETKQTLEELLAWLMKEHPKFFISGDALAQAIDDEIINGKRPMMNWLWPVTVIGSAEALQVELLKLPIVLVEKDGEHYFGLAGGGMDMSWELASAYMVADQCPPIEVCDLPDLWGETRLEVVEACQHSVKLAFARLTRLKETLDNMSKKIHTDGRL